MSRISKSCGCFFATALRQRQVTCCECCPLLSSRNMPLITTRCLARLLDYADAPLPEETSSAAQDYLKMLVGFCWCVCAGDMNVNVVAQHARRTEVMCRAVCHLGMVAVDATIVNHVCGTGKLQPGADARPILTLPSRLAMVPQIATLAAAMAMLRRQQGGQTQEHTELRSRDP